MAEAGIWIAWGIPARGREREALALLKSTQGYLHDLALYWNLSLYSEYNVMLMKTDLTKV